MICLVKSTGVCKKILESTKRGGEADFMQTSNIRSST